MRWGKDQDHELALLLHRGLSTKDVAHRMGRSVPTINRHRRHKAVKEIRRELANSDLPNDYYEGVAAYPSETCPHSKIQARRYCWWMAGYHDAARGMV